MPNPRWVLLSCSGVQLELCWTAITQHRTWSWWHPSICCSEKQPHSTAAWNPKHNSSSRATSVIDAGLKNSQNSLNLRMLNFCGIGYAWYRDARVTKARGSRCADTSLALSTHAPVGHKPAKCRATPVQTRAAPERSSDFTSQGIKIQTVFSTL